MKVHEKWPRYTPLLCWKPTVPIRLTVHGHAGCKRWPHGLGGFIWAFRSGREGRNKGPGVPESVVHLHKADGFRRRRQTSPLPCGRRRLLRSLFRFHVEQRRYFVIELKRGKYQLSRWGQLDFHVALIEERLRQPAHVDAEKLTAALDWSTGEMSPPAPKSQVLVVAKTCRFRVAGPKMGKKETPPNQRSHGSEGY